MSDDEVDHELLDLLRKSLGIENHSSEIGSDTGVLKDAEYIYSNSVDVAIGMVGTKTAASMIWDQMKLRSYSTQTWSEHDLHPKEKDEATVNFIFVMDLLNFSFWSEKNADERYAVEYRDKRWTGYWSLVACLQRALEEGKLSFFLFISLSETRGEHISIRCLAHRVIQHSHHPQTFQSPLLHSMQMKKNVQTRPSHKSSAHVPTSQFPSSRSGSPVCAKPEES